ncbi:hypothetical protein C2S52_004832 [Perilla frutescens var. hirtella]|nr:hypothetical protein C2S52_004832 [Perilla frutescens var. hirtella]
MAGVLPGVEAARRRRFHQSNSKDGGATVSRRSSFSLYAINNQEFHFSSHSSLERDPVSRAVCDDEMLDAAVREAKKRLDQRLQQTSFKSQTRRKLKGREAEGKLKSQGNLQKNFEESY